MGSERVRQSAFTAIEDDTEKKFDFKADAYLIRKFQGGMDMATTGERQMQRTNPMSQADSSAAGKKEDKVYKFKNIHGDRGTYDHMSSQAHNQPPSSLWKDHPIPKHLMEPKV